MILLWSDGMTQQVDAMVEHAHANPVTEEQVRETILGKRQAIGDSSPAHVIHIPMGFKVVYSEEYQPKGLYRHLSISYQNRSVRSTPPLPAVNMILKAFKLRNQIDGAIDLNKNIKINEFMFWWDEVYGAINFLERYAE